MKYSDYQVPSQGARIVHQQGQLLVPDKPIIPFIEGDGIGPDVWHAAQPVLDAAVARAYGGKRQLMWMEVYAGEKAFQIFKDWLPDETIQAFQYYLVGIKGPLTTPVGGGMRSLNVALRKQLDLYVCQRPVRWFEGLPSPVKHPEYVDMVVFRENTEDIYTGIEFELGTPENQRFLELLKAEFPEEFEKIRFPDTSAIGIKPVSRQGSTRLVRSAIQWALENHRKSVTLVHKGNIQKYTEGGFRKWGYELASQEFGDKVYTMMQWEQTRASLGEAVANAEQARALAEGRLLIKDIIADIVFEQTITSARDFDVLATTNLNGDYLTDALAAQVGGIGIAPGGNINYITGHAIFEATHGTAPRFAGQNIVNPGSVILSGEMMLRYMGWHEAADLVMKGMNGAIQEKTVTFDFHRLLENATLLKTSEFGDAVIQHMAG